MKKLRWAVDSGFWELDMSTPATLDGAARAVPDDPLPLGLSRGTRLSRPKQIYFFQRFMSMPFVPSYSIFTNGCSLQRVFTFPFAENWIASLLGQFKFQKFLSSVKERGLLQPSEPSWLQGIGRHFSDKSLYALGLSSELMITPDDTLLVSLEAYGDSKVPRKKAVFLHNFPNHNLMVEAVWPGLFVDKFGTYWDVPLSMAIDLASIPSDSDSSYHLSLRHNLGTPKQCDGNQTHEVVPPTLLPGLCAKGVFALKKNIDLWRSKAQKLKRVQPFDIFLSNPHISLSGIIGAGGTARLGDNSARVQEDDDLHGFKGFKLHVPRVKSALLADVFASVSFTAQHGNFQKQYLDLTRFHAKLDIPSGSKFLAGATRLTQDLYNSQQPNLEAVQAICPTATLSLQQQIAGPFSFRIDSGVSVNLKNSVGKIEVNEPVFAIEFALQVLGSAKAIAWYSPKHKEFMVELNFYET